jgi:hypothetical protein
MEHSHQTIDVLNGFLRGEMAAVEIYRYTLERFGRSRARATLEDCMQSHARRVQLLRRKILAMGGNPARSAGTWGMFVRALAVWGDMLGPSGALSVLDVGESHGQLKYQRKLEQLAPAVQAFVTAQLMPAQQLTREWLLSLKRSAAIAYADAIDP